LKKNEVWDISDSTFSTTEKPYISYKCLNTGATLEYPSGRKISNVTMVLKKVRHHGVSEIVGFNSKHQIVYFSNYDPNIEYNYLLLDKFIPDSIEDSTKTIEWLKINKSLPIINDLKIQDSDFEYIN
jgi:hypothetical protein